MKASVIRVSITVLTLLSALAAVFQTAKPPLKHQVVFELNSPGTDAGNEERLKKISSEGVALSARQNSIRLRKVVTEDLFPFAGQVDSGAAEVIGKQEAGWSYLKSGE